MDDKGYVILGGGMAGFGAANTLFDRGIQAKLYEKRPRPGGLTSSFTSGDGFIFDEGVHISFAKSDRVKGLFAESAEQNYQTGNVYCNNYWKGHWIKHPAQVNLYGLPSDLVVNCIKDFIEARQIDNPIIRNYEDWLMAAYGPTFANTFPMVYTRKYHTTGAANMSTDWLGPRLYRPTLEEVLKGALEYEPLDVFYVSEFRYPTDGGFESFIKGFYEKAQVHCNHELVAIDLRDKKLSFRNGTTAFFERLISSLPLPILVPLIKDVPDEVRHAAERLACTQVVVVNIGVNRPIVTKPQWSYFYDEDIPFSRVSYRDNLSPRTTPPGCGAMQAEIYFSQKYRPLDGHPKQWIEPTIDALMKCGLLESREEIIHQSAIMLPFGNIIFDLERKQAVETVHGYLDEVGIGYCGRFGQWGYIWTDAAFISGERAARTAMGLRIAAEADA
jgi:protoporphyrinogen oxidase